MDDERLRMGDGRWGMGDYGLRKIRNFVYSQQICHPFEAMSLS
jgi:hypothetical protein